VRGDREHVDVVGDHVDGNLAHSLHRVGVEEHAALMTESADFCNGLQDADLVVGRHDRDQDGFVVHCAPQVVEVDQPVGFDGEIRDAITVLLQPLAGIQNCFVFGDLGDDVIAALAVHFGDAFEGQVIALGGAAGEDDLLGRGADEPRNLLARGFDGLLRLPSEGVVAAGRVAELGGEVGHHRLQNPRVQRSGGVVVHIDRQVYALRHFYLAGKCVHIVSILIVCSSSGVLVVPKNFPQGLKPVLILLTLRHD
jgi:hypothetical protein